MSKQIKYVIFETEWGFFGLAANEAGLVRSVLPVRDIKRAKSLLLKGLEDIGCRYEKGLMKRVQEDINAYYKGCYVNFDVPVCLDGLTGFQRAVLSALMGVKYGEIRTYGELAKMAGRGTAVRAVGGVLAINPLPLIIPCHRITYSNGRIGGFSAFGGVKVKKKMLEMEDGGWKMEDGGWRVEDGG